MGLYGVRVFLNQVASRVADPSLKLGLLQIASLPDQTLCESEPFQALVSGAPGGGGAAELGAPACVSTTVSRELFSRNLRGFVGAVAQSAWHPEENGVCFSLFFSFSFFLSVVGE